MANKTSLREAILRKGLNRFKYDKRRNHALLHNLRLKLSEVRNHRRG